MPTAPSCKSQVFARCNFVSSLLAFAATTAHCPGCASNAYCYSVNGPSVEFDRDTRKYQRKLHNSGRNAVFQLDGKAVKSSHRRKSSTWLHDSGASMHCCSDLSLFHTIRRVSNAGSLVTANNERIPITHVGTIVLTLQATNGNLHQILLPNVVYSPTFSKNILSVSRLWHENRLSTKFGRRSYLRSANGDRYQLQSTSSSVFNLPAFSLSRDYANSSELWHRRFMHSSSSTLTRLSKRIKQLRFYNFPSRSCDACQCGGGKRQPFRTRKPRRPAPNSSDSKAKKSYSHFGERISTDLCGPFEKSFDKGYIYAIVFHDAATRHIAVYYLQSKTKEEVLQAFKQYLHDHRDYLVHGVKEFHSDCGSEYINSDMDEFCEEICVRRSFTVPYCPPQNPYAERAWGTLLRKIRICLFASGLHDGFWNLSMQHATFIHNITLRHGCDRTPMEQATNETVDYNSLKPFGCKCYYLLPESERTSKLSPRALPAVYLGTDPERKGSFVFVPHLKRITTAYHLVFSEMEYLSKDDMDGTPRFKIPTNKRVTIRLPHERSKDRPGPVYRERRDHGDGADIPDENFDEAHQAPTPTPVDDPRFGRTPRGRDPGDWAEDKCEQTDCTFPRGHAGRHSFEPDVEDHAGRISDRTRNRLSVPANRASWVACARCGNKDCESTEHPSCPATGCEYAPDHEGKHSNEPVCKPGIPSREDGESGTYIHVVFGDVTFDVLSTDVELGKIPTPESFEHAISGKHSKEWWASMRREIEDLLKHETWELVSRGKLPAGRKPTKSRWVYTIKYLRDGTVEKFKSRFVVCGYSQVQGKDFTRAFSATLRSSSFRCLLAIASGKKLKLEHFDVTNAFTQADLDDVLIFVEPPKGFDTERDQFGTKVLKLKKALYGTKQASRLWQTTLADFLENDLGFTRSRNDPCLFLLERDGGIIILGIYVDDIIVAYRGNLFDWFKSKFLERFRAKHIGPLYWFLGIAVDQSPSYVVSISQERYIKNMVEKYAPEYASQSLDKFEHPRGDVYSSLRLAETDEERSLASQLPYMNLVGALLYIAVMTRPDISFHCSILSKFMSDPTVDDYKCAQRLLLYVAQSSSLKITYDGQSRLPEARGKDGKDALHPNAKLITNNGGFVAYSDSSWGNKVPYPMFGFCIFLFGGVVAFASKQLKVVAFSSCEAEYAAAAFCCREIEFIRAICADMGFMLKGQLVLILDNTAAIDVAENMGVTARTKHFDMCVHYFRDLVQRGKIKPIHVLTIWQKADGFTKGLDKTKFLEWNAALYNL